MGNLFNKFTIYNFSFLFFFYILYSIFYIPKAYALPPQFFKEEIATGFNEPTDFTQTPDGRFFVIEKSGRVKVVKDGQVLSNPAISLPVSSNGERGLLGITLDPNFSSNKFVYLFYINANPLEYHLSRFSENNNTLQNESVLYKSNTNADGRTHLGGGLQFGPDGKIWFTIGENTLPEKSQDLSSVFGKLLRINPNGSVPSDNPFAGQSDKQEAIWAYGLRNPFRFSFLPDGRPIIGDVGGDLFEEINIGVKGANYGWPLCEGPCNNPGMTNPSFSYPHTQDQSGSISGGFVYTGDQFPNEYKNNYFYGDYVRGYIHRLNFSNGTLSNDQSFDDTAGTAVSLRQGNDGSIYFITIYPGTLYRVKYSLENQSPTAKVSANTTNGYPPLQVSFSSNGSQDPEGQPLSYKWDFGDGSTSTEANPVHTYTEAGNFNAKLIVKDGQLESQPASIAITVGNSAPEAIIESPKSESKYNAGDTIFYSGKGLDQEDGELPGSAFSWTIIFHHLDHIHPFLGPINGVKSGQFKINDISERSANTFYEIVLTVNDSTGLKTTTKTFIYPNVSSLTINSDPIQNLVINVNGIPYATPFKDTAVVNFKINIEAVTPVNRNGIDYDFESWSDGGTRVHEVTIPKDPLTLTAKYKPSQTGNKVLKFSVIAGDVNINGKAFYDNDPTTGMVVLLEEDADVVAPWGKSIIPNPDIQTAENTLKQVTEEVKARGCGSSCQSVISFKYPSGTPAEKVVSLSPGQKAKFEKYSVVSGDIKINGSVLFDDKGDTGLVVLMLQEGEVEAPFGATVFRNSSQGEAEALQTQLANEMKQNGCSNGCQTVAIPKWP